MQDEGRHNNRADGLSGIKKRNVNVKFRLTHDEDAVK